MLTPKYLRTVEGYTVPYYGQTICVETFTEVVREFSYSLMKSQSVNMGVAKILWKISPKKTRKRYKNPTQLYTEIIKQAYYNVDRSRSI
ncbi:MAG: hypothetical protein QNJ54_24695 [Prochloraceae cyanobacterium]|nr:hypothetical protein [Prochloraceae cyanobacterium]